MTAPKPRCAWKSRTYPVPNEGVRFRWKASALRGLQRWSRRTAKPKPAVIVVPALYNRLPAETVALGWLNEIDALHSIRQRMATVARLRGWDVFTFHTQHNLDHFYDTTISAVRETWSHEGGLSVASINETKKRFGNVYDYHRVQPRLVENLVFQSSLMDWVAHRAEDLPFQFHAIGTGLYSALVWAGSISFEAAVESAVKVGLRWDKAIRCMAEERSVTAALGSSESEIGWRHFEIIQQVIDNKEHLSLAVARDDLPKAEAPSRPFWFSPCMDEEPVLIETSRDASLALESLNLTSWACDPGKLPDHSVRGWLVSPLHTMARSCRWSVSNYLLSTPSSIMMFMNHIASLSRAPMMAVDAEVQNRLRLSRIKVTGP
jgi:hypothetical protein